MLVGGSGVDVDSAGTDGAEGRRLTVILYDDSQRLATMQRALWGFQGIWRLDALHKSTGYARQERRPIARPEKRVDCSQQKDNEMIDSRQATLSTWPPTAAVPATGLVM